MPYIYDDAKSKACLQCKNSSRTGSCSLKIPYRIETIRYTGSNNTYSCDGFEAIDGKPQFQSQVTRNQ